MKTLPNKHGEQVRMTKTWLMYLQLFVPYVIAAVIWGIVFSNILISVTIGVIIGLAITLFSAGAISKAQTVERRVELVFTSGSLWGPPPIWIGTIGLIILIAKLVFKF